MAVPSSDLISFAFHDAREPVDQAEPVFIDANNAELCISKSQARTLVIAMIAGLRSRGLREGNSVLLCIGNHFVSSSLYTLDWEC